MPPPSDKQDAFNKIRRPDSHDSGEAAIFLADYADEDDAVYEALRKYLWGEYYRSAKVPHGNYNPVVGQIILRKVDSFSIEVLNSHFDPYLQITAARNLIHRGAQHEELASNPVYQAVKTEHKILRLPPTKIVYHQVYNQTKGENENLGEIVDDGREGLIEIVNAAKNIGGEFCLLLKRVLAFDNFPENSRRLVEFSREQKTKEVMAQLVAMFPSKDDPLLVLDALDNRYGWESGMLEGYGPKLAADMIVSVAGRSSQYAGKEQAEYKAVIGQLLDKASIHWTPLEGEEFEQKGGENGLDALKNMAQNLDGDNLGLLLQSIRKREPSKYVADDLEFALAAKTNDAASIARVMRNDPHRFLDEGRKLLLRPETAYISSILPVVQNMLDQSFLTALWEQSPVDKNVAILEAVGRKWSSVKMIKIVEEAEAKGTADDLKIAQAARRILAERQQEHWVPKHQKVPLPSPEM